MTSNPPDPDPSDSTGLEPGGGVPPGETPPDSGTGETGGASPGPGRRTFAAPALVIGAVVLVVVVIALFFVGRLMG